jgi:hypothetical protein
MRKTLQHPVVQVSTAEVGTKFVVSCVVDRSGLLRNLRVLQNSAPDTVTRVLAMLHEWRFRPVLRGNAAIEVNAIVGFNIDTR